MTSKLDSSLYAYARDACQILGSSLALARRGQPAFYRVCAAQLRLLLCDTTRQHGQVIDVSLLPRLFPDIQFQPLKSSPDLQTGLFDPHQEAISLAEWLQQRLPIKIKDYKPANTKESLTIRDLIRQVCDHDGGAHVDPRPNTGLGQLVDYPQWVLAISEYVAREVTSRLFG
jgi:hypothetical protein